MKTFPVLVLTAVLAGMACVAAADVLPPGYARAQERFAKTQAYDRTDQYCAGKAADAACVIPGNAFEGGGAGICARRLPRGEVQIDLLCELRPEPVLERDLPRGKFKASAATCEHMNRPGTNRGPLEASDLVCEDLTPVHDRFCRDKKTGEPCQAELRVGSGVQSFAGVCRQTTQIRGYYMQGNHLAERRVVQCEPANPTPQREMRAAGSAR